jgi:hypothetical protein
MKTTATKKKSPQARATAKWEAGLVGANAAAFIARTAPVNPNEKTLPPVTRAQVEFAQQMDAANLIRPHIGVGYVLDVAALLGEEAPAVRRAGLDDVTLSYEQLVALRDASIEAVAAVQRLGVR